MAYKTKKIIKSTKDSITFRTLADAKKFEKGLISISSRFSRMSYIRNGKTITRH